MLCFCKVFNPILQVLRFMGAFPFEWSHNSKNQCQFKISKISIIITSILIIINILYLYDLIIHVEIENFRKFIVVLTKFCRLLLSTILLTLPTICVRDFLKNLQKLSDKFSEVVCELNKQHARKAQFAYIASLFVAILLILLGTWLVYADKVDKFVQFAFVSILG